MIIAIDECGDFQKDSPDLHFFVAVHIRQAQRNLKKNRRQFFKWERDIPNSVKNHKGEIKGSALTEKRLEHFLRDVLEAPPYIGVTPIGFVPRDNPERVIKKHKEYLLNSIDDGVIQLENLGNTKSANFGKQLGNWVRKLNYQKFVKISLLGKCVATALRCCIGHSITGQFDDELVHIKYKIDQDFIKDHSPTLFWKELLRCQIYHFSKTEPLPLLDTWRIDGHPFLTKFEKDNKLDLNGIYWKNCNFVHSHEHWEVRVADIVGTILNRVYNRKKCVDIFPILDDCCWGNKTAEIFLFNDFADAQQLARSNPWMDALPPTQH